MKYIFAAFSIVFMILAAPSPVLAQQGAEAFTGQLRSLNRTPATRNPAFQNYQRVFTLRILDSNRQWVGDVADLKIDSSGFVAEVIGDVDKIGSGSEIIRRPVSEVTFHDHISSFIVSLNNGYTTSPEALAAIAPAAGNGGEVYSFKAMKEAEVRNIGGKWIGVVKDVLVDEEMQAVKALVLEDVSGARRYTEIAIPFDPDHINIHTRFGRIQFRLTPEAAKAVTDFAKERR